jgi:hypothetical protein
MPVPFQRLPRRLAGSSELRGFTPLSAAFRRERRRRAAINHTVTALRFLFIVTLRKSCPACRSSANHGSCRSWGAGSGAFIVGLVLSGQVVGRYGVAAVIWLNAALLADRREPARSSGSTPMPGVMNGRPRRSDAIAGATCPVRSVPRGRDRQGRVRSASPHRPRARPFASARIHSTAQ